MKLFDKSDVKLINYLNKLENKIDIINANFNSIKQVECCDCKLNNNKLFVELKEFFDNKINEISTSNKIEDKIDMNELLGKYLYEINEILDKCLYENKMSIESSLEIKLFKLFNEKTNEIKKASSDDFNKCLIMSNQFINENKLFIRDNLLDFKSSLNEKDLKFRQDLQTLLLEFNLKNDVENIKKSVTQQVTESSENSKKLNNMSETINLFFYDNEIIKHQIMIEEDIRCYFNEIENIKMSLENIQKELHELFITV